MNKIKLFYDVVKVLKGKDLLQGVASAEIEKDQTKIFGIKNEFQKNLLTKQAKANITTEIDYEGKQVKHQSTTEFTNHCSGHGMHHKLFRPLHHAGAGCSGFKEKLTKIAFVLGLLQNMKVEEQADQTTLVTLEVAEIPEDIKAIIQQKMARADACHGHRPPCFMKEFCVITTGKLSFAMSVKANNEIEKITIAFDAVQCSEQDEQHTLNVIAELKLT